MLLDIPTSTAVFLLILATIQAVARTIVVTIALRNTKPKDRAAILRALRTPATSRSLRALRRGQR